jgi:hypothetical protein
MTPSAGTLAMEAEILLRIERLLESIRRKANELVNTINATLAKVEFFIGNQVAKATDSFVRLLRSTLDGLDEIVSNMGSPSTLSAHADIWNMQIGAPVVGLVLNADLDQTRADNLWTGDAATAYKDSLPPQKAALSGVKTVTDGISNALSEMARAIWGFWLALVGGLAALIAGIIAALASSATIVGLPAGPFIAGGAALVFIGAAFVGAMNLKSAAADQNTKLGTKLADAGFNKGHWPATTSDFSDGSMSDGDPSDWHLKATGP